jgi:ribonuclease T2
MPVRQAHPLRDESQQSNLENNCPDMPRIPLHPATGISQTILASCKVALFLFISILILITAAGAKDQRPGQFDYYVLALSWSPSYCAGEAGQNDHQQCAPGRRFAFVVHGLWPQHNEGWPEYCRTREGWIPQPVIDGIIDVMPSKKLIIHEWKKHGTCSGLSQKDYFNTVKEFFGQVRIPARYLSPQAPVMVAPGQLVGDFVKTNKGLTADMLSVQCGNARDQARLSELRVCVNKEGSFIACGLNETRQCRAKTLVLLPVK